MRTEKQEELIGKAPKVLRPIWVLMLFSMSGLFLVGSAAKNKLKAMVP